MTLGREVGTASLLTHLTALAEVTPTAPALVAADRAPLLFGALVDDLTAIGRELAARGYGDDTCIATLAPPGPETAVALLAISGAATCAPLDPRLTRGECEEVLRHTGATALAGPASLDSPAWEVAHELDLPILRWSPHGSEAGRLRLEGDGPSTRARLEHAYAGGLLMRTSGTSSTPKLVPVDRARILARSSKAARLLGLGPDDRCLNLMPLCYMHALHTGLTGPLSAGGSVICPPTFERAEFIAALESLAPSWYTAGATHQRAITGWLREGPRLDHRLRFVRSSSAPLEDAAQHELETLLGVPVVLAYGTTETGPITANPPAGPRKAGSVGVTTEGDIAIVDDAGTPVAAGVTGEVVVGGPTVFAGYLDDPDATQAALRDGWFHTGDVGSLDDDGYLTLAGRDNEVINRGGEKVSPTEVDAHLLAHPDVVAAATFAIPHPRLGEDVAVAVQYRQGATVTERELRRFLLERLTSFKVPRRIVAVDGIPVGATGKPLRRVLTDEYGATLAVVDDDAPVDDDASPLEESLRAMWTATLDVVPVGRDDDFFALGGDSLAAVELLDRIEDELGLRLSSTALIELPTIRELAHGLQRRGIRDRHLQDTQDTIALNAGGSQAPLFVVSGRLGHVFRIVPLGRALGPDQPVYALQPPRMDWDTVGCRTMGEMAAHYAERIRTIQPQGPYRLLGTSFGGLVMFEVARALHGDGERVELLALIDTVAPPMAWDPDVETAPRAADPLDDEPSVSGPVGDAARDVEEQHQRARSEYVVRERFDGELLLVVCTGRALVPGDTRGPWCDAATKGARVLLVPGGHFDHHHEPQLSALRELLSAYFRGDPPQGLDPAAVFDRSFTVAGDALMQDDGVHIPIVDYTGPGSVDVVQAMLRVVHVAGTVGPERGRAPELVVFVDGTYAGRGTALPAGEFKFRLNRTARRSVRVFLLDGAGAAAEVPHASSGWKVGARLRLRHVLRLRHALSRTSTR